MQALLVFHGFGVGWPARLLHPGFRHCFVALPAGGFWLRIDGADGVPSFRVEAGADYDLAAHYRGQGFTVIETAACARPPRHPFMLASCVGMAKRVLGIRAPRVLTPYQLFRHLSRSRPRDR